MRAALVAEARTIAAHSAVSLPEHADCLTRLADALEAAEARVKEIEAQLANAKAGWGSALRIVNSGNEIIKQVGAERDAATAAVERVRALETFSITDSYPAWTAVDHDDLRAALDGAPEPEVKP